MTRSVAQARPSGLAEAVMGDRKHFHLTAPTTPGGNLIQPPETDDRVCSD